MVTEVEHEGGPPQGSRGDEEWAGPAFEPVARMSLKSPAVIVLVIALVIVIGGITASALTSGTLTTLKVQSVTLSDGTVVHLEPGTQALKPIAGNGEPPADILAAVAVPAGATTTGSLNSDQNTTQFDRTVNFTSTLPAFRVHDFYQALFKQLGWKLIGNGPDTYQAGSTQLLAEKGSNDGFYWEAGVVVSPTTSAGVTPFTLRLFEVADPGT
ncbi:MAG TPA: hypothetical protein VNV87_14170 [Acidimicrobiales bacterium]|jgi:hypothetical protein|nr:hypothetical protein [Acidimicrobiales bacterium]